MKSCPSYRVRYVMLVAFTLMIGWASAQQIGKYDNFGGVPPAKGDYDELKAIVHPIGRKFPIGVDALIFNSLPPWRFFVDDKASKNQDSIHQYEKNLYQCWISNIILNPRCIDCLVDSAYFLPYVGHLEAFCIGGEEDFYREWDHFKDSNVVEIFTHRFPDMGTYEAYYIGEDDEGMGCWKPFSNENGQSSDYCLNQLFPCNSNGLLLLYNRKSKFAKILRIHYIDSGGEAIAYRFFSIKGKAKINIYGGFAEYTRKFGYGNEGWYYSLAKEYEIKIRPNGEIKILEIIKENE